MHQIKKLKNGLTLITIPLPHLDSVTTLVAVGVGSRYEDRRISGMSHFLEHMFFKGSRKYPTAEIIANLVDGIGAINNAATDKEVTYYWVKAAAKHIDLASDILSSQIKESLFADSEINKEKGVIVEEIRMYQDNPSRFVWQLFDRLLFGDQPLGWDIAGSPDTVTKFSREDFVNYVKRFYAPKNMVLVYAGKLPENVEELAEKYFQDLPENGKEEYKKFKAKAQKKAEVSLHFKETDQVNLVLGLTSYSLYDEKRYAAKLLSTILGEGMSSRLFREVREKRGLAYTVFAFQDPLQDTGVFAIYGGLNKEKIDEGIKVIKAELERITLELVTDEELKKAKEMERGRVALRSESTNFLAEYFGIKYVLTGEAQTFKDYLQKIEGVTAEEIREVAKELFKKQKYNLQLIGPFKDPKVFEKILNS